MERFRPNGLREEVVCPVVSKARGIASEKGLDPSKVRCPFSRACNWNDCVFDYSDLKLSFKEKETHLVIPLTPDARKNG